MAGQKTGRDPWKSAGQPLVVSGSRRHLLLRCWFAAICTQLEVLTGHTMRRRCPWPLKSISTRGIRAARSAQSSHRPGPSSRTGPEHSALGTSADRVGTDDRCTAISGSPSCLAIGPSRSRCGWRSESRVRTGLGAWTGSSAPGPAARSAASWRIKRSIRPAPSDSTCSGGFARRTQVTRLSTRPAGRASDGRPITAPSVAGGAPCLLPVSIPWGGAG
jgi:hypothetical protein